MKWISRFILVAALAIVLSGWVEQRQSAQRGTLIAAQTGPTTNGWWQKFKDRVEYIIYGEPQGSEWLNARNG